MTNNVERPAYLICKYSAYYRPNSQGYTDRAILAGRYTLADAESITHPNGPKGPRDGMTYIHEDEVKDKDWLAHRAAIAAFTVTPQEAAKVYALWGSTKYRDIHTELVGVFSDKEGAESTGRALFKEKMDGAATVFQERVSGPYPLKGYCDDVSYKFWVESLSVNAAIAQEDSQ